MKIHHSSPMLALVLCWACSSGAAAERTCENQIVFDSDRSGTTQIHILDIASGETTQVTRYKELGANSRFPDFAPGGGQMVFVSANEEGRGHLYLVGSNGDGLKRLTNDEAALENPAWSPDGEWVAFEMAKAGTWGLYLIRPDGSSLRRVGPIDANLFHPSWSPDASKMAIVTGTEDAWIVGVLDVHDQGVRNFSKAGIGIGSVKWSPTGTRLVFDAGIEYERDLYMMDLETQAVDRLTTDPAVDARPEWSPDMMQLVFHSTRDRGGSVSGDERWEEFELYLLDLESRDIERLTNNTWFDAHPDWCVP